MVTDAAQARIVAQKGATTVRIEQFYGKWAFWRLWGIQEPASVLFSLLNLYAHVKGLALLRRRVPHEHPMLPYYVGWSLININAWTWSTVFHTRGSFAYFAVDRGLFPHPSFALDTSSRFKLTLTRPLLFINQ